MALPLLPVLATFLGSIVAGLAFRVLTALGIAYATFTGLNELLDYADDYIKAQFAILPIEIVQIFGLAKIDVCINIIISAIVARFVLSGMGRASGAITSFIFTPRI